MRSDEFSNAINMTPQILAVFEVETVPDWLATSDTANIEVGTRLYWNRGTLSSFRGQNYNIGHRYLKFLGYARARLVSGWGQVELLEEPREHQTFEYR